MAFPTDRSRPEEVGESSRYQSFVTYPLGCKAKRSASQRWLLARLYEMVKEQSEFWSKVAQKYDRVIDLQIRPKTRSMVRERVAKEGRLGNLAEFGCGTGFYTQVLAGKADSVLATDVSPGMLEIAKDQIKDSNVTFQAEDCQKTSLHDGAFDTAFISLVIHFTEPDTTLTEMRCILKAGGTLIIANVDPLVLNRLNRVRCLIRVLYHGLPATGSSRRRDSVRI